MDVDFLVAITYAFIAFMYLLFGIELTMHNNEYSSDSRYITATLFVASGIFVFLSIGKMLEFLKLV